MSRTVSFPSIPKPGTRAWPSDLLRKIRTTTSGCCNTDDGIPPSGVRDNGILLNLPSAWIQALKESPRLVDNGGLHLRIPIRCNSRVTNITLFLPPLPLTATAIQRGAHPKREGFILVSICNFSTQTFTCRYHYIRSGYT